MVSWTGFDDTNLNVEGTKITEQALLLIAWGLACFCLKSLPTSPTWVDWLDWVALRILPYVIIAAGWHLFTTDERWFAITLTTLSVLNGIIPSLLNGVIPKESLFEIYIERLRKKAKQAESDNTLDGDKG